MSEPRFPDPWPSRQPSWPPAPWIMSGTVLTAWFDLPREQVAHLISPSLVPPSGQLGPSRLRFYELDYRPASPDASADATGSFREAVIGLPATYGSTVGDISAHMWSDSDTYMHWGRDVFGWPVLRASVELEGEIWASEIRPTSTGAAMLELADGSRAAISVDSVEEDLPPPTPAAWITPRLIASPIEERRELLVVRPTFLSTGHRVKVTGDLELSFREPHPLARLEPTNVRVELSAGIKLRVGDVVEPL